MIKFDSETGSISIKGTGPELVAGTIQFLHAMYESIKENNPNMADIYKHEVENNIPYAWKSTEELKEISAKMIEEKKELVNDLTSLLEKMKEMLASVESDQDESSEEPKDIRSADFDSDEQFQNWFRGEDK